MRTLSRFSMALAAAVAVAACRLADETGPSATLIAGPADRPAGVEDTCDDEPTDEWSALLRPLVREDSPREQRLECLRALAVMGRAPDDRLGEIARPLIELAGGEDDLLAGAALLALRQVCARPVAKYGPEQWRKFVARRVYEIKAYRKAQEFYDRVEKEFEANPAAAARLGKEVFRVGLAFQENVRDRADVEDAEAYRNLLTRLVRLKKRMDRAKP